MPHTESTREAFSHEAFVYTAGEEFLAGVVGALHDVWQLVEDASDVKEG